MGVRRSLGVASIAAITEALAHPPNHHRQPGQRRLSRMPDRAATLETGPIPH